MRVSNRVFSHPLAHNLSSYGFFLGKLFAHKSSYDSDSPSATVTESQKVLVPGGEIEDSPSDEGLSSDPKLTNDEVLNWFDCHMLCLLNI